jgi:hypothetical protein
MKILILIVSAALFAGCEVYTDSGSPEFVSGFADKEHINRVTK